MIRIVLFDLGCHIIRGLGLPTLSVMVTLGTGLSGCYREVTPYNTVESALPGGCLIVDDQPTQVTGILSR